MKPINTALCSYGMSGLVFHGPLLQSDPNFKITKILERNRQDSAGKHPGASIVKSFESILDDPEIELVIVNTPDQFHYAMSIAAIEHGKHLVVEKPLTYTAAEAEDLIRRAEEKGVLLTVFQNRRWDGDFLTVQKVIRDGALGRLVDFESHFDRYRNYLQESWKDRSFSGTGTLFNLGSHLIDQALQLFGIPDRLYCDVRMLRDGAEVDDSYDLFLHYPDVKCLLRSSYLVKEPGPRFILHGTEGSFLKWGLDPQEEDLKKGEKPDRIDWGVEKEADWGRLILEDNGETVSRKIETLPGDYTLFYRNVYKAIRHGEGLLVKPEEAVNVIRIIEAAYESGRMGQAVKVQGSRFKVQMYDAW